jgi:hypothetical protein
MAIAYVTTLRNTRMDAINTAANAGAGAALIRIYDGTRPATGGAATTLLAELTATDPMFSAAASGVLTASAITQDASANATGTASWFRVVDSTATVVMDGNCGTSGSDLNLTTLSIVITQPVSITSFVLTEGNP